MLKGGQLLLNVALSPVDPAPLKLDRALAQLGLEGRALSVVLGPRHVRERVRWGGIDHLVKLFQERGIARRPVLGELDEREGLPLERKPHEIVGVLREQGVEPLAGFVRSSLDARVRVILDAPSLLGADVEIDALAEPAGAARLLA